MRKLMLSVFVALLTATAVFAQGTQSLKAAEKAIGNYATSQDEAKLQEAVDAIQTAMNDSEVMNDYEAHLVAGDIYSAAITAYVSQRVIANEALEPMVKGAAAKAAKAYITAYQKAAEADKKKGKKEALKSLQELQGNISNEGIYAIQDEDYEQSFASFMASIEAHDFLTSMNEESKMTDENALNDERYYAALSALLNERFDVAEPLFITLYDAGYEDAGLYDGLYKVYSGKGDMDKAGEFLTEGREKYPDETQLLFAEINHYLAQGRLDVLTGKLEKAIEVEPTNVSLYATLGSVYDRLYQKERDNDAEKAEKYFEKAKKNYEDGLKKEPENASLIYSLGALYFNRAAAMTEELLELGNDLSREGQAKYDAMEARIDAEFDLALPYFQKAEMTDPNNVNTLIALKEMYARNDDYEASNEFKARLETVQSGEKIERSYFKEKGM